MGPNKVLAFAGAAAALLATTAANAADFPAAAAASMVRAPVAEPTAGICAATSASATSNSSRSTSSRPRAVAWPATWRIDQKDIKDTFFFAAGLGYAWNNWLRFDVTGEYRADVKFKAVGSYTEFCPAAAASTSMTAIIRPRCSWPTPISISERGGA